MDLGSLLRWFAGRSQETCPRCGGPMTIVPNRRRWLPPSATCERCDLRARWAESPERRRI